MLKTTTIAAKTFWAALQRTDMGMGFSGPDDVEVFAAAHLGEVMSPTAAEAVFASIAHWEAYDGHRGADFLFHLIETLNQIE